MKKKTSVLAIIISVLCSILLFPLILFGGISSGTVFSMASLLQQNREEELYQSFINNGGIDFVYDLWMDEAGEEVERFAVEFQELFPKDQVENMFYDIYHALIKGEQYAADFSTQKEIVKEIALQQFDENLEEYRKKVEATIEEEFTMLEKEFSESINSIFEMEEYQKLKEIEAEYGFSLTDRTELCYYLNLGGCVLLGLTGVLMVILLLCHLFRPSGFFTAGAFALLAGGVMMAMSKGFPGIMLSLIGTEMSVADIATEEFPAFVMPMINEVLGWCMTGFEKVGKIGLMAAVLLILVGILLLVIRRNQAEQNATMEMQ